MMSLGCSVAATEAAMSLLGPLAFFLRERINNIRVIVTDFCNDDFSKCFPPYPMYLLL